MTTIHHHPDFEMENFAVLVYSNGWSHWHYDIPVTDEDIEENDEGEEVTTDAPTVFASIEDAGYFNTAHDRLKVKDLITVTADEYPKARIYAVVGNAGGVVKIAPIHPQQ